MRKRDLKKRLIHDPEEAAEAAGLHYVSDNEPGIRRLGAGKGFRYVAPDGSAVKDQETLVRIRSLAIPPAYRDVWISPDPRGHLQAVGHDQKGRKQYRYHPNWHSTRGETKFTRTLLFGRALPKIRAAVERDLALPGLPREKVLAAIVRLLERSMIRVGNEESAKEGHYGLTTMKTDHLEVERGKIHFSFVGKSGVEHEIDLKDPKLAKIVKRLQDLPGQELFQFKADDGSLHHISSTDVNAYIKEISGDSFTAKDFRTWAGTVLAALALREAENAGPITKKAVTSAVKEVASRLGNTPAVCRKAYIHPSVLEAAMDGGLALVAQKKAETVLNEELTTLRPEESAVLRLLEKRLSAEIAAAAPLAA